MMKLQGGDPSRAEEAEILDRMLIERDRQVQPVLERDHLLNLRNVVDSVYLDNKIRGYILDLVMATRNPAAAGLPELADLISFGASPRATLFLARGAKAIGPGARPRLRGARGCQGDRSRRAAPPRHPDAMRRRPRRSRPTPWSSACWTGSPYVQPCSEVLEVSGWLGRKAKAAKREASASSGGNTWGGGRGEPARSRRACRPTCCARCAASRSPPTVWSIRGGRGLPLGVRAGSAWSSPRSATISPARTCGRSTGTSPPGMGSPSSRSMSRSATSRSSCGGRLRQPVVRLAGDPQARAGGGDRRPARLRRRCATRTASAPPGVGPPGAVPAAATPPHPRAAAGARGPRPPRLPGAPTWSRAGSGPVDAQAALGPLLHLGFPGPRAGAALKAAASRHDLIVVEIVDPRDQEIPAVGPVVLRDAETGEIALVDGRPACGSTTSTAGASAPSWPASPASSGWTTWSCAPTVLI